MTQNFSARFLITTKTWHCQYIALGEYEDNGALEFLLQYGVVHRDCEYLLEAHAYMYFQDFDCTL